MHRFENGDGERAVGDVDVDAEPGEEAGVFVAAGIEPGQGGPAGPVREDQEADRHLPEPGLGEARVEVV